MGRQTFVGFAEFEMHRPKSPRGETHLVDGRCGGCKGMGKCIETSPASAMLRHYLGAVSHNATGAHLGTVVNSREYDTVLH